MNEIKIFNDERFAESSTERHLQMFGALCYMLAEAVKADDKKLAWDILNEASKIGHVLDAPAFNALYTAAAMEVTRNTKEPKNCRKSILEKIKEYFV